MREQFSTRTFALHVLVVTSLRSTSQQTECLSKPVKFSLVHNQRRSVETAAFRGRINDSAVCGEVVGIITVQLSLKTQQCPHCLNITAAASLPQNASHSLSLITSGVFSCQRVFLQMKRKCGSNICSSGVFQSISLDAANDAINISLMRYGHDAWCSVEETR